MVAFLAFLVLTTIFLPMVTLPEWGLFVLAFVFALTIISGAFATIQQPSVKYFVVGLTLLSLAVDLMGELIPRMRAPALDTTLKTACLVILVCMTLNRTLRPGPVTVYRVVGGIAGYLLIGYTWAFAYQLFLQENPAAIYFDVPAAGAPAREISGLIYFSFTTLTTVGYGDIHPVHPAVRSLAVAEALVGQLYLAILISSLVGMALQARSARDDDWQLPPTNSRR
jgi:hypothetical protein